MRALAGRTLLLVEDDEDSLFLLADALRLHGACVTTAQTGEEALAALAAGIPDVLVADLELGAMDGNELLRRVRNQVGSDVLPGIALTGHGSSSHRDAAFGAGFAKLLLKPAKVSDLVAAVLAVMQRAPHPNEAPGEIRELLAQLSDASPCRFTSLLRFADDETLSSVWTHDRENPQVDPFPLGLPIEASYCTLVRASNDTCAIEDAFTDPRAANHSKRTKLASYIGVPLRGPDGQMFGTLCSFDPRPLKLDTRVRAAFARATHELEAIVASLLAPIPTS